jgi:hypothetical protein
MSQISSIQLSVNESTQIQTNSVEITYTKAIAALVNPTLNMSNNCTIQLPSNPCLLFDSSVKCSSRVVIQQSYSMSESLAGRNGQSYLGIGWSESASLSFHNGVNEIQVTTNLTYPILLTLARDPSIVIPQFIQQNFSVFSDLDLAENQLAVYNFSLSSPNSSFHFHLQPDKLNTSYLLVLKYDDLPVINTTVQVYDSFTVACGNLDLKSEANDQFFVLFASMSANQYLASSIGVGVRELHPTEIETLCFNRTANSAIPVLDTTNLTNATFETLFTTNYSIRAYSSGCYYLDPQSGMWRSDGMDVLAETNMSYTYCSATHLTEFAGGFIVLPPMIDFAAVWSHASPVQNPTIYATVIFVISCYLILIVACLMMDYKDRDKKGMAYLANSRSDFLYEIVVFTGNRNGSQTDSKVRMVICGNLVESKKIYLYDKTRKPFRRGGVDSFIVSSDR